MKSNYNLRLIINIHKKLIIDLLKLCDCENVLAFSGETSSTNIPSSSLTACSREKKALSTSDILKNCTGVTENRVELEKEDGESSSVACTTGGSLQVAQSSNEQVLINPHVTTKVREHYLTRAQFYAK